MKIILAGEKDIRSIAKLVNEAYRGPVSRAGWTHEADLIDGERRTDELELKELMQKPGCVFLVYKEDNNIAGSVFLERTGSDLYLGMLSVHPSQQDKGIGRLLVNSAEKYAKDIGCEAVIMTVISVRKELIEWYQRLGYVPTGETKPFPEEEPFGKPLMPLEFITLKKKV